VPIEVKGGRSKAVTLSQLMKQNKEIPVAYKLIDGNMGEDEKWHYFRSAVYGHVSVESVQHGKDIYRF